MQITVKQSNGQRSSAIRDACDRRCAPTITRGRPSQDDIVHRGKVALPDNSGKLPGSRCALHARLPLLLTKSPCTNLPREAGSRAGPWRDTWHPSLAPTFPHAPPPPKAGGGFSLRCPNGSRCGIICPTRCPAFQCWNFRHQTPPGLGLAGARSKGNGHRAREGKNRAAARYHAYRALFLSIATGWKADDLQPS